jgi:hypothetical protein
MHQTCKVCLLRTISLRGNVVRPSSRSQLTKVVQGGAAAARRVRLPVSMFPFFTNYREGVFLHFVRRGPPRTRLLGLSSSYLAVSVSSGPSTQFSERPNPSIPAGKDRTKLVQLRAVSAATIKWIPHASLSSARLDRERAHFFAVVYMRVVC